MENDVNDSKKEPHTNAYPVETDYEAHKEDPRPAPTVNEPDNEGAGQAMKWVIPLAIVVLFVIWFFFFRS